MKTALLILLAIAACRRPLAAGETRCVNIGNGITKCRTGVATQAKDADK